MKRCGSMIAAGLGNYRGASFQGEGYLLTYHGDTHDGLSRVGAIKVIDPTVLASLARGDYIGCGGAFARIGAVRSDLLLLDVPFPKSSCNSSKNPAGVWSRVNYHRVAMRGHGDTPVHPHLSFRPLPQGGRRKRSEHWIQRHGESGACTAGEPRFNPFCDTLQAGDGA